MQGNLLVIAGAYCESTIDCNKIAMWKERTDGEPPGQQTDTRKSPRHNEMGGAKPRYSRRLR